MLVVDSQDLTDTSGGISIWETENTTVCGINQLNIIIFRLCLHVEKQ